jgi:sugar/nucleoside kinase (ribokinase family)
MTAPGALATVYVIGNVNVDLIMGPLAPWPAPGTESLLARSDLRVGGAAGNSALALRALGTPFRLVCNMGDDPFGRWLAEAFGPAATGWPRAAMPTTVSVGLTHPNGERTFLTSKGHLEALSLADVQAQLPATAAPGDITLLLGSFLSPALLADYESLLHGLGDRGFTIALDTGWPPGGWNPELRQRVAGWLASCDHVLLNEIEGAGLSGEREVEAAAAWIAARARPGATAVVKCGPLGATGWRNRQGAHAAAPKVAVIDTIGAGDAFDAGYLTACLQGRDLAAALADGVAVASAAISTSPRRYGPEQPAHASAL